jgi:hypothetical protein
MFQGTDESSSHFKTYFAGHSEQSEGSQPSENMRFFAWLRMTNFNLWEFFNSMPSFTWVAWLLAYEIPLGVEEQLEFSRYFLIFRFLEDELTDSAHKVGPS